MSHQKTKRVQSPIKGKSYSMIRRNNELEDCTLFNSRLTQKRKPIFNDTLPRQQPSRSSLSRRKIFTQSQNHNQASTGMCFTQIKQVQQMHIKNGDFDSKSLSQSQQSDSISSSSIESNEGLEEVRKRLFPSTPIKKKSQKSEEISDQIQFLSNSCKKLNFDQQYQPPKSTVSVSTNNVDRTVLKTYLNTPVKKEPMFFTSQKQDLNSFQRALNFQTPPKKATDNSKISTNKFSAPQPEKDLAKQLRQLHQSLVQKSKTSSKVEDLSVCLKKQNQFLKRQNERLKQRFLQFQAKEKNCFY